MDDFCYSVVAAGAATGAGAEAVSMDSDLCGGDGGGLVLGLPNRDGSSKLTKVGLVAAG